MELLVSYVLHAFLSTSCFKFKMVIVNVLHFNEVWVVSSQCFIGHDFTPMYMWKQPLIVIFETFNGVLQ